MAQTEVFLYQDEEGAIPLRVWLDEQPRKVQDKCIAKISRLAELGNELRRPEADFLRDGIYELRASYQGVHYRMLYFFAGKSGCGAVARIDKRASGSAEGNRYRDPAETAG